MSLNSTRRFSKRADWYSKYRPSYPPEIIGILERKIGFAVQDVVADIGSGTGLLSRIFLENENRVFGVEPNNRMRSHAERDLAHFSNFVSVKGTAEHTTLRSKSVDLVTAGQALHWFDPEKSVREFARISKPSGSLCIVYNERRNDRFGRAYWAVVRKHERDRAKIPNADDKYIARFFKDGDFSKFELPNEQMLDFEGLLGRLLSASYIPSSSEKKSFARLRSDVQKVFERFSSGGRVRLRYITSVFVGETG